jgi:hypothetical protein
MDSAAVFLAENERVRHIGSLFFRRAYFRPSFKGSNWARNQRMRIPVLILAMILIPP